MSKDYRESHTSESHALSYHRDFSMNPYRAMMWRLEKEALDSVIANHVVSQQPVAHLDFACGTGRIIGHLSRNGFRSCGVDVSEAMLAIARIDNPKCDYIMSDLTSEDSLEGRKFDLITAFRFFPNAQEELRLSAVRSIAKHLAPNGVFIFNNHKNHSSSLYSIARAIGRKDRTLSIGEVQSLLDDCGLCIVETIHLGVIPSADRVRLLPARMLEFLERKLARFSSLKRFASNHIYVCKFASKNESH